MACMDHHRRARSSTLRAEQFDIDARSPRRDGSGPDVDPREDREQPVGSAQASGRTRWQTLKTLFFTASRRYKSTCAHNMMISIDAAQECQ